MALYEDRETTVQKRMSTYTANNHDNFPKLSLVSNVDSRHFLLPINNNQDYALDSKKASYSSLNLIPENAHSQVLQRGDAKDQQQQQIFPRFTFEEVQEAKDEEAEEIEPNVGTVEIDKPWCLAVDDNPFNLMVVCHMMKERGYQMKTALNGQEAVDKVVEHEEGGQVLKVILMDCQMPVMDGYESSRITTGLMREGKVKVKECPVIALTANARTDEHEKLIKLVGTSGHVSKPLKVNELEDMGKHVCKEQGKKGSNRS